MMPTGKIKWFSNMKGWGFITSEEDNKDVLIHFSAIKGHGYKKLTTNQPIVYEVKQGEKGLYAVEATPLPMMKEKPKENTG